MLLDGASGLVIHRVGICLNFLDVIVGVQRGLNDFKVLHELQCDLVGAYVNAAGSSITERQPDSEDRFNAVANDLYLARIHRQHDADVSGPQAIAVLAVIA